MPLTWSVENVENYQEVTTVIATADDPNHGIKVGDALWSPITNTLVMLTMGTGINTITAENVDEVFARIRLIEKLHGAMLIAPGGGDRFITREEIEAHVGLRTNASSLTRAQFLKQQAAGFMDDEARRSRRERERARKEAETATG